ncbi:MAG: hypothetical protein V4683_15065 [Bacteroidota bacterium]
MNISTPIFKTAIAIGIIASIYYSCKSNNKTESLTSNIENNSLTEYAKLPFSLGLPLATTIPGFRNRDSLVAFLQDASDDFSWRTFIGLNWPADADGNPDTAAHFGDNERFTVLEHWMPSTSIYRENNLEPKPWNYKFLDSKNEATVDHGMRLIAKLKKFDNENPENEHLIDQNKNYTYYEVFYNKQAYDYVKKGKLYNKAGQQEFAKKLPSITEGLKVTENGKPLNIEKTFKRAYLPVGNFKDSTKIVGNQTLNFIINPGAIIVKTAWKEIAANDDKSKFFITKVKYKGKEEIVLGLVGMHIMHKVAEATQWVWSSFAHVDNAPQMNPDGSVQLEPGVKYNYFNTKNLDKSTFNKLPDTSNTEKIPTQVVSILPAQKNPDKFNKKYLDLIKKYDSKSVWQYYRLLGTQWPFKETLFTNGDDYQPSLLANPVMETFFQANSSCMKCHSQARFLKKDPITKKHGMNADFVWGIANVANKR